jgi:para-aminobenzoate synthetase component 1
VGLVSAIAEFMKGNADASGGAARIALIDPTNRVILIEGEPMPYKQLARSPLLSTPDGRDLVMLVPYDAAKSTALNEQIRSQPVVWKVTSKRVLSCDGAIKIDDIPSVPWTWQATGSDDEYRTTVSDLVEKIRSGRFYQINLLRHFYSSSEWSDLQVAQRLLERGGPYSAWIRTAEFEVVSFSPERFVNIRSHGGGATISTFPIKGTVARAADEREDENAAFNLKNSTKDRAELNMIVDLMRNDLYPLCLKQSISVIDAGSLKSFKYVHHLEAEVRGRLREDAMWGEAIAALCPAGSITGAPKVEVIKAIDEVEKEQRGFLMGNIFYCDADAKTVRSSVLIRTMQRIGVKPWHFAAGSGIVVKSDPQLEWLEVKAKCKVACD